MKIRPATRRDLPGILKALADLPVTTGEGEVFEIEESRAAPVFETILKQEGRTILLAVDGDDVIGAADLIVVPNLTHDCSPWAMVENVVVSESRRGQGIGKALMEEAIRRSQEAGCYKIQLMSFKERKDAHEFYRSLGFEPLAEGFRMYF